ncbi:MAG TPA: hypothetical protein VF147_07235, partial [Vicinamibacterales bacterium]
ERDKERVLDGLEGAAAGSLDRAEADRILSALGKRVFLLHDVHEKAPVVFQTRWTLSYLRGPLSRDQIRALTAKAGFRLKPEATGPSSVASASSRKPESEGTAVASGFSRKSASADAAPVVPPGIPQVFIPASPAEAPVYTPVIVGAARVAFSDAKLGIDVSRDVAYAAPIGDGPVAVDWAKSSPLDVPPDQLAREAGAGASFLPVPQPALAAKNYAVWQKAFAQYLAQAEQIELFRHTPTKLTSKPEESERDFRIRLKDAQRAQRDEALEAVRQKYAPKQAALAEKLRRAQAVVEREQEQASQQKMQTALSVGATVLGALFGRKALSTGTLGRATTAARGASRTMKEASDVKRASESMEAVQQQIQELEEAARQETQSIAAAHEAEPALDRVTLSPKRGQVTVQVVALGWDPR